MKKALYMLLLIAAVWVIAMVLLIAKRKNVVDEAGKRKTKIAIELFMLIPLVSSVVGFTWFVSTTSW